VIIAVLTCYGLIERFVTRVPIVCQTLIACKDNSCSGYVLNGAAVYVNDSALERKTSSSN